VNAELKAKGLFGNVSKFIDASAIVSKTALWEERDRAIADGAEQLNNANVKDYAADTDARWGAKSDTNIWFGYKRVHAVDMRYGLIEKLAVTPANVLDFQVLDQVCPDNCMVFTDKLFDCKKARLELQGHRCHAGIIRKNNNREKNRDLDRWLSQVRMPFEGTFSKLRKRAKFRGKVKVLFQCFAEAICHNLRKAVTILPLQTAP
jgi:IS5 family transposase